MPRFKGVKQTSRKKDTPQKTSVVRRIGLKETMKTKVSEIVPEDAEATFNPVHRAPVMAVQSGLNSGTEGSEDMPKLAIDTSVSSDEDSSVFDSSSSPPSPELFREKDYEDQCTFWVDDDLHIPVKNSTLLEQSNAENIATYHQPNLSTIMDTPTVLVDNSSQDTTLFKRPSDGLVSGPVSETACKTPAAVKKSVLPLKKRVWFRSPLFSDRSRRKSATTPKKVPCNKIVLSSVGPPSPHKNIEPEELKDDVNGGVFFDFGSDSELEAYLNYMRERCTRLKNNAPFPSTALRPKEST